MNRRLTPAQEAAAIRRGEHIDTGTRDYLTTTARDGTMLAHPIPADCHACGRPLYYDSVDEGWHHATAPEVACAFLPSEARRDTDQPATQDAPDPEGFTPPLAGPERVEACIGDADGYCFARDHRYDCTGIATGYALYHPATVWCVIVKYQPDNEANDGRPAASVHLTAESAFLDAVETLQGWLNHDDDLRDETNLAQAESSSPEELFSRLSQAWQRHGTDDLFVQVVRAQLTCDDAIPAVGRAAHALGVYRVVLGYMASQESANDLLSDLFTDLRHWCDAIGADPYAALDRSYGQYLAERPLCPHCGDPLTDPDGTAWTDWCPSCNRPLRFCSRCDAPTLPGDAHDCGTPEPPAEEPVTTRAMRRRRTWLRRLKAVLPRPVDPD